MQQTLTGLGSFCNVYIMTFKQFRGASDEGDINNKVQVIIKMQVKVATSLEKAYNSVTSDCANTLKDP